MNELIKINASDYGLEETKAQEIASMFVPMLAKMSEYENEYNDILKEEINPETCQRAKDLRLSYVKVRTGTAEIHKKAKEFYLKAGRFIDSWKNTQLIASGEKEQTLKAIEDHFENMERERLEKLRAEREMLLSPYTDAFPGALGHMEQITFDNTLLGFKTAYNIRIAAERKIEEDRIAKEKADAEERERQRLENIRLKAEAEEREKQIAIERNLIKKENETKEIALQKERAKAEADLKAISEQAKKEREERERLESKIAFEKAQKVKQEASDLKAKKDQERKTKLAPDKDKLLAFGQALNDVPRPEIKSIEYAAIMSQINGTLAKLNQFILENAQNL